MSQIWAPNGNQINAHEIAAGSFISPSITKKRIEILRNNTAYREAIEKAQRMAGYVDPALSIARGCTSEKNQRSLFKQNEKAEQLIKGKRNETTDSGSIIL